MFAFPHQGRNLKKYLRAVGGGDTAPALKSLIGSFDSFVSQFFRGLVKLADDLGAVRGVNAGERRAGLNSLAADHQWIFAPEFAADLLQGGAHRRGVLFFVEISKWFVPKFCWHGSS